MDRHQRHRFETALYISEVSRRWKEEKVTETCTISMWTYNESLLILYGY